MSIPACLSLIVLSGAVLATPLDAAQKGDKPEHSAGEIVRIEHDGDGARLTLLIAIDPDKSDKRREQVLEERALRLDQATEVIVDGARVTIRSLVAGRSARVRHHGGQATRVVVGKEKPASGQDRP